MDKGSFIQASITHAVYNMFALVSSERDKQNFDAMSPMKFYCSLTDMKGKGEEGALMILKFHDPSMACCGFGQLCICKGYRSRLIPMG
ncbi:hypothetical protein SASPL_120328 [Salvia splendens]|uniref:Uncharacterized protein n=1 Tax=Salvia splendens TaxID=180675 RepID=A0A8X8XSA1_SALSN|nr:hypothetical protein SASPL_120328 [Salvia splendens]